MPPQAQDAIVAGAAVEGVGPTGVQSTRDYDYIIEVVPPVVGVENGQHYGVAMGVGGGLPNLFPHIEGVEGIFRHRRVLVLIGKDCAYIRRRSFKSASRCRMAFTVWSFVVGAD